MKIGRKRILIEQDHLIQKLVKWLPAGPLPGGGVRKRDMIQFIAAEGGFRTVATADLVL